MSPKQEAEETAPVDADAPYARDEGTAPQVGEGATGNRIPIVLLLVAGALIIALAAFAIVQLDRANDADAKRDDLVQEQDDRLEAATIAGRLAEALLTYDYQNLGAAREAVLELVTDDWAEVYDQAFTEALGPAITQLQTISEGEVRTTYVADLDDEGAKVIVVADAVATSATQVRSQFGTYIEFELVREGDTFRVDKVRSLATIDETQTARGDGTTLPTIPGDTTTTTTTPC